MYYYGEGVSQDYLEAKKRLTLNAMRGHAESQALLGLMYQKGQGTKIDLKKAIEWLEQSALQCNDTAQNWLSALLWKQRKEKKDNKVRAFVWAYFSAEQKYESSYPLLTKTKESLSKDELNKAKAMIKLIRAKYHCGNENS